MIVIYNGKSNIPYPENIKNGKTILNSFYQLISNEEIFITTETMLFSEKYLQGNLSNQDIIALNLNNVESYEYVTDIDSKSISIDVQIFDGSLASLKTLLSKDIHPTYEDLIFGNLENNFSPFTIDIIKDYPLDLFIERESPYSRYSCNLIEYEKNISKMIKYDGILVTFTNFCFVQELFMIKGVNLKEIIDLSMNNTIQTFIKQHYTAYESDYLLQYLEKNMYIIKNFQ